MISNRSKQRGLSEKGDGMHGGYRLSGGTETAWEQCSSKEKE
jgi:hypothetical protein